MGALMAGRPRSSLQAGGTVLTSIRKVQLLSHKRHADDGAHAFYRSLGFASEAEGFRIYLDR
ncbi:MAG: hypothetical protein ACRD08_05255 [Acidimicrobiales bacterium]